MSGYELKKAIDNSVNHFWNADQSQIYRTLSGLVDDGLATRGTALHDDRPNSHPHSLTDSGSAELDRWLASPLVTVPAREPFLVRLFFADRLPIAEIRRLVAARRQERSEALAATASLTCAPNWRGWTISTSASIGSIDEHHDADPGKLRVPGRRPTPQSASQPSVTQSMCSVQWSNRARSPCIQ